ncbi:hypothetical protein Cme02nite_59220 [Catellatospora methionotrophica]|uniref:Uncharacterized protein n=1 Tax=Catellatospora methionotrophica TaxID=121620 RepID=A0A8J3LN37_9ACTN|nr:hypothetical protein Cme02nite_59220 [Catellatospora methionotrophica]
MILSGERGQGDGPPAPSGSPSQGGSRLEGRQPCSGDRHGVAQVKPLAVLLSLLGRLTWNPNVVLWPGASAPL